MLLLVETSTGQTVAAPSGYSEVPGSPVDTGDARLTLFWKRASAAEVAPVVVDSGDHQEAQIFAIAGALPFGNPFNAITTATVTTATTAVSFPAVTTTLDDCLIVHLGVDPVDENVNRISGWTNATLGTVTERIDIGSLQGDGGGHWGASAPKTTAGSTGNTTATLTTARNQALMTLAIAANEPSYARALGELNSDALNSNTINTGEAGVSAWLELTQADNSVFASGGPSVAASATPTQDGQTVAATGTSTIVATVSATQGGNTLAATGGATVTGSASITQAGNTIASTVSPGVNATLSAAQAGDTLAASGSSSINASAGITQAGDTLESTLTIPPPGFNADITQADNTIAATAGPIVGASAALNAGSDSIISSLSTRVDAALAATQQGDTVVSRLRNGMVERHAAVAAGLGGHADTTGITRHETNIVVTPRQKSSDVGQHTETRALTG